MPSPCFLILCMQNDLCHPEGIYAQNGLVPAHIPNILPNVVKMMHFCKEKGIPIFATLLSIITDLEGKACSLGSAKKLRPFLEKEGFRAKSWGHDLLQEISYVNYKIHQWGMSPFHQTELDRFLEAMQIDSLILSGFTTNGAVESCAREAVSRQLRVTTLTDCVASYSDSLHEASLVNLGAFGQIMTAEDWIAQQKKKMAL
ncbi:MAG: cysteine hydrolase [Chlamydiota bacterium]